MNPLIKLSLFGLGLLACSAAALRVPLDPISTTVPTAGLTAGKVIYSVNPSKLQSSLLTPKSLLLEGKSGLVGGVGALQLLVYVRNSDPSSTCTVQASVALCDKAGEKVVSSQPVSFKADGSLTPFVIGDVNNAVLLEGIKAGQMWLGFEITAGVAANTTLKLTELTAVVTVF